MAGRVMRMVEAMSGQEKEQGISVGTDIDRYNDLHDDSQGGVEKRNKNYADLVNSYYNLATDFYEWGWGQERHPSLGCIPRSAPCRPLLRLLAVLPLCG